MRKKIRSYLNSLPAQPDEIESWSLTSETEKNFRNLDTLRRSSLPTLGLGNTRKVFAGSSFEAPLTTYLSVLDKSSTGASTAAIHIINVASDMYATANITKELEEYRDDIARKVVKFADDVGFKLIANTSTRDCGMLVHGITTAGGPRGWRKETLIDNCKGWVNGDYTWGKERREYVEKKMDRWIGSWVDNIQSSRLPLDFDSFCADPMKWATGGGARKKTIPGLADDEAFRSKWAWAISTLANSGPDSVYREALKEPNVAAVALKEETKTRLVITTPMASYLRQSYLLHCLGRPGFLRSTLSDPDALTHVASQVNRHYICIDASRFDQNFPKWGVTLFFSLLEQHLTRVGRTEIADIARQEKASLDSLTVRMMDKTFEYRNGLLSGWRITSLLGSMASAVVCEYINEELGRSMDYVTQGDDIIMVSQQPVDVGSIMDLCKEIGVQTHPDKCMFGDVGEFLKYTYVRDKIVALPARTLRSIFYINPWLDKNQTRGIQDVANNWSTLLSRTYGILPEDAIAAQCFKLQIRDLHKWAVNKEITDTRGSRVHLNIDSIKRLLTTPTVMGGLGNWETAGYLDNLASQVTYTDMTEIRPVDVPADEQFLNAFGISTRKTFRLRRVLGNSVYYIRRLGRDLPHRRLDTALQPHDRLEPTDNYFATMVEMMLKVRSFPLIERISKQMKRCSVKICKELLDKNNWPTRLVYRSRWQDVMAWAMGNTQLSMPTSYFVNTRYDVYKFKSILAQAERWYTSAVHMRKGDLWVAIVYLHRVMASTHCWLHTL